jgi:hypothetical protein
MRLVDKLDAAAKRHKIAAWIIAGSIIVGCLYASIKFDEQNDAAIRWEMATQGNQT